GMYVGSTGPRGLRNLVFEVADNSINEAISGYCTQIQVDLNPDGSVTVTDDGRGIPTSIVAKTGKSFLETVFTVLHSGCRRKDCESYKVSRSFYGTGLGGVNPLCEWLQVTVWQDDRTCGN
ncbi:MAG: hypothetical protein HC770_14295, partial [Pseudanabaena sp. CRU_2_10]|nr:hypothetical protein [Pseudanabaena sp. CRU_2_10]